jgi:ankyrin repeat protein
MEETPLIEASFCGNHTTVALLLKRGADRSAKDAFGRTALEVALERGHPSVVAALTASVV